MKNIFRNHYIIVGTAVAAIAVATVWASFSLNQKPIYDFMAAKKADITQAVSENGVVKSAQNLDLSFQRAGNIARINVAIGQQVKKGQSLVELDSRDAGAAINQAKATVETAQANYEKVATGATSPELDVTKTALVAAQTNYDNAVKNLQTAKQQQDVLVQNAYRNLLNSVITAVPSDGGAPVTVSPIITGSYTGIESGVYNIRIYSSGSGLRFDVSGLEFGDGRIDTTPQPLGTMGLFIQFPTMSVPAESTWVITIPNTSASNYVINYNAYQAAQETENQALTAAQAAVDATSAALQQAQAALALKQAPARAEDVAIAKAQVDAALAQMQNAQNMYANGVITAPIDGIVATLDAKIGELASPSKTVVSMISQQKFEIDTNLSETDLAAVKVGDVAHVTLDAYGPATQFAATVISIEPAATQVGAVKTYKATLEFTNEDDRIKDGMAANITIIDATHANAIVVPTPAIITKNLDKFVLVNAGNGIVRQQQIKTGIVGLDGYTEVTAGLNEGDLIVTFGN